MRRFGAGARRPLPGGPAPRGIGWALALLVALLLAALPATASAHTSFAAVDAGPERVRVEFDADVEEAQLLLEVRDRSGAVVSGPPRRDAADPRAVIVAVMEPVRDGTVRWRVLSQDGHVSEGSVDLADGVPGAVATAERAANAPLPLIARVLLIVVPIALLGLVVMAGWVLAPAVAAGGIVAPGPDAGREAFRRRATEALVPGARRWWAAWWAALALGTVGLVLQPLALMWTLRAGFGDLGDLLFETRAGRAWWCTLGGFGLAAFAGLVVSAGRLRPPAPPAPERCVPLAAGPLLALVALSWGGHASSGKDRAANIVIDLLHNLATAAWLGGLFGLIAVLPAAARRLDRADSVRLSAAVVVRFSSLAVGAVAVLVVTGVYRALAEVTSLGDLVHTAYGRALLVKLCLFGALLIFGAVNRFVVHPRLERAALGLAPDDRGAGARLAVSLRAEVALGLALLVAVAVMLGFVPPR